MIAVIFEAVPNAGREAEYFQIAADLAGALAEADGFISVERFQSLADPGKLLSLSFWRDEAAVARWRTHGPHRLAASPSQHYLVVVTNVTGRTPTSCTSSGRPAVQ